MSHEGGGPGEEEEEGGQRKVRKRRRWKMEDEELKCRGTYVPWAPSRQQCTLGSCRKSLTSALVSDPGDGEAGGL